MDVLGPIKCSSLDRLPFKGNVTHKPTVKSLVGVQPSVMLVDETKQRLSRSNVIYFIRILNTTQGKLLSKR